MVIHQVIAGLGHIRGLIPGSGRGSATRVGSDRGNFTYADGRCETECGYSKFSEGRRTAIGYSDLSGIAGTWNSPPGATPSNAHPSRRPSNATGTSSVALRYSVGISRQSLLHKWVSSCDLPVQVCGREQQCGKADEAFAKTFKWQTNTDCFRSLETGSFGGF